MRTTIGGLRVIACLATAAAALGAGCAGTRREPDTRPVAECPVCKCNADLGCLIVHVDRSTPRSELYGKSYYFCSEECKRAFDRSPRTYVK